MKKLAVIIHIFLITFFLFSCNELDTTDYTEDLLVHMETVKEAFPEKVNHDFTLPQVDGVTATYEIDGEELGTIYAYESPLYDHYETITIFLQKGRTKIESTTDIYLISLDSGFNENRIELTLDVPIDQVNTETYVHASVTIKTTINGERVTELQTDQASLRSRGNSTQMFPKKPYRLKFDEETSIFGMRESNSFVLLAEYSDKSLMRNVITHKMSTLMSGIDYALETRFIELYVNGEYLGVYVLTEQIEIENEKLDIESIPGASNTGFLIELDMRFYDYQIQEGFHWFTVSGYPYEIKSPDMDDPNFTTIHAQQFRAYMEEVQMSLIVKEGYDVYIDLENWVDYFVIQEVVKNVDVGFSSVYMHKAPEGKLMFGPLWDFDLSYGNADYIDYDIDDWYGMRDYKNRFFKLMMDIQSIRNLYHTRLDYFEYIVVPKMVNIIDALYLSIEDMAERNFNRWDILDIYVWPNPIEVQQAHTHEAQVELVKNYLVNRTRWMVETAGQQDYYLGIFD